MSDEFHADYESRLNRSINEKLQDLQQNDRLRHVLFSSQFNRRLLERLGRLADRIRLIAKGREGMRFLNGLLSDKRAMLYFTQPSTRTFLSFTSACQILGLAYNEVRDPQVSSESKGESPFDSMRMFSSYFDLVIMRSHMPRFAECCAYMMNDLALEGRRNIPVINGGAGKDEHPTQSLLDVYTIQRLFSFKHRRDSQNWTWYDELREEYPGLRRKIDHKIITFCGDVRRGRTVRSLAQLLALYDEMTLCFVAPPHDALSMPADLRQFLLNADVDVREMTALVDEFNGRPLIESTDCLYMTRLQAEHNSKQERQEFERLDFTGVKLTQELVRKMKRYAAILHPFPRDSNFGEIPTVIDHDNRAYYFRQARNGMWVRAALIAHLFDVDSEIADYFETYTSRRNLSPP